MFIFARLITYRYCDLAPIIIIIKGAFFNNLLLFCCSKYLKYTLKRKLTFSGDLKKLEEEIANVEKK